MSLIAMNAADKSWIKWKVIFYSVNKIPQKKFKHQTEIDQQSVFCLNPSRSFMTIHFFSGRIIKPSSANWRSVLPTTSATVPILLAMSYLIQIKSLGMAY